MSARSTRATTAALAAALPDHFTILNYDRRRRGDSGDSGDSGDTRRLYSVERETEDIHALIGAAGGSAAQLGYYSILA